MAEQNQPTPVSTIWNYTGSITISCGCGTPIPVIIPFSQGMKLKTRCRTCQSTFALHGVHIDLTNPSEDSFAIEHKPHLIVQAASQMPDIPAEKLLNNVTPFGPIRGK